MPPPYRARIRSIQDGEPLSAAVANRPALDAAGNAAYLLDRLDAATLGSALFMYAVPAAPGLQVGQPVYWDAANGRVAPALAAIAIDQGSNAVVPQASAGVIGVCSATYAGNVCDVCTQGVAAIDLTASAGADAPAGYYYLSTAQPGGLVRQSPAISVPVLFAFGDGTASVQPQIREIFADHVHYTFNLYCLPAGTTSPPAAGQRHVITAADPTKPGWLPASDASFGGRAPAGAAWGYKLAAHPQLAAVWPPLPAGGAVLFWDKGDGGTLVPQGIDGGLVVVDAAGIFWMSDCNGNVPWPADYDSANPPAPPGPDTSPPTCPYVAPMSLTLGYYVSLFASRMALVTQLRARPGDPVTVTDWDGDPATAGALEIGIDWPAVTGPADTDGAEVLKTYSASGFTKGYVAEGVQLSGAGLSATATRSYPGVQATATATVAGGVVTGLTLAGKGYGYVAPPAVTFSGGGGSGASATAVVAGGVVTGFAGLQGGSGYTSAPAVAIAAPPATYQGLVLLQPTLGNLTLEVAPDVVKLVDAAERSFATPSYIGLAADRPSSVVLKYEVPPDGLPANPTASVRVTFYGPPSGGTGTLPPVAASYLRLPDGPGTVPGAATPLTLATGQSLAAGAYLPASTSTFPVAAGDTLFVTLSRAGSDGYAPEVGLLRYGLVIAGS